MSLAVVAEPMPKTTDAPLLDPVNVVWAEFALCRGKTHLFYGPPGERPSRRRKRETLARSYCFVCPVLDPCRATGRQGYENGLWGAENEEERAAAGFAPRATERRSVARAAREARSSQELPASA